VSTRDALIKLIAEGQTCGGHYNCGTSSNLQPDELAEAAQELDRYVHELAEQQRAEAESGHGSWVDGLRHGADLIDPAVTE
jgi:hypothetical protein